MKKYKNDFDLKGALAKISNTLGIVSGELASIQPLASTMAAGLKAIGITPPSNINDLAATFQAKIIVPFNGVTNGDISQNIINFVRAQMTAQANGANLTAAQLAVANGGKNVINRLDDTESFVDIVTNPFFIIGFLALLGLIWYATKK